jgi:hypothetical protein
MPFSQSSQISTIVQYIEQLNPTSLLDVGIGMGQYGFLARINLENINLFEVHGSAGKQRSKEKWSVRIDGIEACDVYLTPVHEYCYNNLMIDNALEILPTLADNSYELVLAIDILEHFTKTDGLEFLTQLKRIANKAVLISTPKEFIPQEVEANPYENHRSFWKKNELIENGFSQILENDISWIAISKIF